MNASKEACARALDGLGKIQRELMEAGLPYGTLDILHLEAFLFAAYKRLPRESSFQRKKPYRPRNPLSGNPRYTKGEPLI
jgi:hypothetical protein